MNKPNILLIFADQLRYSALGCNGNPLVMTPNLDRFSREGVSFDNAFSSCPICSPYRAQILTGNYAHTNGVICNEYRLFDNQKTLPQILKPHGYRSAYVGKWHLGYGPYPERKRYGFDDMYAYNCIHNYYNVSYWHNEEGPFPMVDYAPHVETELALNYLKEHGSGEGAEPTCVVLSWGPPHWNSLGKTRRYGDYPQEFELYDPDDIELSENVPRQLKNFAREEFADYYGMVSSLDACVGRILQELETSGLSENTIVCFSSDHGDHLSSHGYMTPGDTWIPDELRASKATPYEEASHIPFIIRCPNTTPGPRRIDGMFSSVDVLPTLAELVGISKLDGVQGTSFAPVLRGEEQELPDSAYLQILGPGWPERYVWAGLWRAVRTQDALYARWNFPEQRRLLIDLNHDKAEMVNQIGEPRYARLENEMEDRLLFWLRRTGDPFDSAPRLPETGMIDYGQAFITRSWYDRAPGGYAEAIRHHYTAFDTGELESDPLPDPRV